MTGVAMKPPGLSASRRRSARTAAAVIVRLAKPHVKHAITSRSLPLSAYLRKNNSFLVASHRVSVDDPLRSFTQTVPRPGATS
jgi:hypothetical protein